MSSFDHFEWARAELASAQALLNYFRNKGSDPPQWAEERFEAARAEYEQQRNNMDEDMRNVMGQV